MTNKIINIDEIESVLFILKCVDRCRKTCGWHSIANEKQKKVHGFSKNLKKKIVFEMRLNKDYWSKQNSTVREVRCTQLKIFHSNRELFPFCCCCCCSFLFAFPSHFAGSKIATSKFEISRRAAHSIPIKMIPKLKSTWWFFLIRNVSDISDVSSVTTRERDCSIFLLIYFSFNVATESEMLCLSANQIAFQFYGMFLKQP